MFYDRDTEELVTLEEREKRITQYKEEYPKRRKTKMKRIIYLKC